MDIMHGIARFDNLKVRFSCRALAASVITPNRDVCVSCDKFLVTHYTCGGKPNVVVSITDFLVKLYFHLIIIAAHQSLIRVIAHNHALLPSCMYKYIPTHGQSWDTLV